MNKKLLTIILLFITLLSDAQFIVQSRTIANCFGDSYAKGMDGPTSIEHSFVRVLESRLNCTVNNTAEGGAGVNYVMRRAFTPTAQVSAINNTNAALLQVGFNDAIRCGNHPNLLKKIYNGHVAFFANYFLASAKPLSDASITKIGTWTNVGNTSSYPLKSYLSYAGTGRLSSTSGDKITFSSIGTTLVVGYITADSAAVGSHGKFNVVVDGVLVDVVDTNNGTLAVSDPHYTNAYGVSAYVNHNLGSGSHVVELVLIENNPVIIDYVGTLMAPSDCAPVFVAEIPKIDSIGYSGRPYSPSDATFDLATTEIWKAVKMFPGYPLVAVSVNEFLDPVNLAADHVHYTDAGHAQEADAFMSVMSAVMPRWFQVSQYTDVNGKTKMFAGINGRYNPDGSFTQIDGNTEMIGTIYNTSSTSTTVAIGDIRDASGASFSPKYVTQFDNAGKDQLPYKGSKTASGTGATVTVTVAHSCPSIPGDVFITPRSADCKNYYIGTINSTSFQVVFPLSVSGTNNIQFDWKCKL